MADLATTSMSDLGEVMDYPRMTSCGCDDCKKNKDKKKEEEKKHYPRQSFTTDQLPSLKGLDLGAKVKIVIEAEVVAVRAGSEYEFEYENEKKKNQTKVTLKLLTGTANKMEDKKTDNEPGEKDTYDDRVKKNVGKFAELLDQEDED